MESNVNSMNNIGRVNIYEQVSVWFLLADKFELRVAIEGCSIFRFSGFNR